MRIPSQFNDETLYGRRAKRPSSAHAYRRLLRLAIALVLVIVLMGQASQPRVWRIFFGDPQAEAIEADQGLPVANSNSSAIAFSNTSSNDPAQLDGVSQQAAPATLQELASDSIDPAVLAAARVLTRQQTVNEQRQWTVLLDRWQSGESFPLMRSFVPQVISKIDEADELSDTEKEDWVSMLRRFDDHYGTGGIVVTAQEKIEQKKIEQEKQNTDTANASPKDNASELTFADLQRLNAWLASLDEAAVNRVIDGSVWRSQDLDAFYRQLDQAHKLKAQGAVAVSVVPLMQQPQVYLGSRVRVRGTVGSAEKKKAGANPFGVTDYWELWVKPDDGGDRPMVLILPDVPKDVKAIEKLGIVNKGPEVSVVGRFFKRLAYPSGIGADAAPVVIGRVMGFGNTVSQASAGTAAIANRKSLTNRFLWTLGAALLIGLSLSAAVMWRTGVVAKQSRELRNRRETLVEFPEMLVQNTKQNAAVAPESSQSTPEN